MNDENAKQSIQSPVQENVSSGMNPKTLLRLPIPLFVVAAYLAMGFLWDLWHPGWLIFLAIPVYYGFASMLTVTELRRKLNRFPIAPLCVLVFLLFGLFLDIWHPTWLIFLLIPVYYVMVSAVFRK